jgi:hydrogenase 3 maturation protease
MLDLREQLQHCLLGRVCLVGLGNTDYADDGFGVRLAEELAPPSADAHPPYTVMAAGVTPEMVIGGAADGRFDHVIFLDAVEFGGEPGETVFLDSAAMAARFPQISTHKLSLGLLARSVEADGRTKAWLLGVQPESLKPGQPLSGGVRTTLELLRDLVRTVSGEVLA